MWLGIFQNNFPSEWIEPEHPYPIGNILPIGYRPYRTQVRKKNLINKNFNKSENLYMNHATSVIRAVHFFLC